MSLGFVKAVSRPLVLEGDVEASWVPGDPSDVYAVVSDPAETGCPRSLGHLGV